MQGTVTQILRDHGTHDDANPTETTAAARDLATAARRVLPVARPPAYSGHSEGDMAGAYRIKLAQGDEPGDGWRGRLDPLRHRPLLQRRRRGRRDYRRARARRGGGSDRGRAGAPRRAPRDDRAAGPELRRRAGDRGADCPADSPGAPAAEAADPGAPAFASATAVGFETPRLRVYSELADLLRLDPIHDVDAAGWPVAKS